MSEQLGGLGRSEVHTFSKREKGGKSVPAEGRGVDVGLSGLEEKGSSYFPVCFVLHFQLRNSRSCRL